MVPAIELVLQQVIGTLVVSCGLMSQPLVSRVPPADTYLASGGEADPQALVRTDVRSSEAYYQFMLGRHLESTGDIEEAIKAFRQAGAADPLSAESPGRAGPAVRAREPAERGEGRGGGGPQAGRRERGGPPRVGHGVRRARRTSRIRRLPRTRPRRGTRPMPSPTSKLPGGFAGRQPDPAAQVLLARLYSATRQHAKAIPASGETCCRTSPGWPRPWRCSPMRTKARAARATRPR